MTEAMEDLVETLEDFYLTEQQILKALPPKGGNRFDGEFVVYSRQRQTTVFDSSTHLTTSHPAVSRAMAEAMASDALSKSSADIAVAIAGVDGPEPDEDGNPIGRLHIAVAYRGREIRHLQKDLGAGTRGGLRVRAMTEAMELLAKALQDVPSELQAAA